MKSRNSWKCLASLATSFRPIHTSTGGAERCSWQYLGFLDDDNVLTYPSPARRSPNPSVHHCGAHPSRVLVENSIPPRRSRNSLCIVVVSFLVEALLRGC